MAKANAVATGTKAEFELVRAARRQATVALELVDVKLAAAAIECVVEAPRSSSPSQT